jgi:predicted metal-dependent enzyme (double-stranded beta helix superfamily)
MFDVDRFVADCRAGLAEPSPELAIKEVLERAVRHPADLTAALGTPPEGRFVTLHSSPELTILDVVWTPGLITFPHDHRMWAIIGLYGGREDNTFYRRAPAGLATAGGRQLERGDVAVLGQAVIHSVANPLREFTRAIHIYGGDFFDTPRSDWDPDTLQERPYDMERTRRWFAEANERWRAQSRGPEDPARVPARRE